MRTLELCAFSLEAQKNTRRLFPLYSQDIHMIRDFRICMTYSGCRHPSLTKIYMIGGFRSKNSWEGSDMLACKDRRRNALISESYARLLKQCCASGALADGRQLHVHIQINGLQKDKYLNHLLISMYCKCGSVEEGRKVFEDMPVRDVVSWSAMISGYAQDGHFRKAIVLFRQMLDENVHPNRATFLSALKACTVPEALSWGRFIHDSIVKFGVEKDVVVGTALINMYHKCGSVEEARQVFDKISKPDVVSWTSMIATYADSGCLSEAICLLKAMEPAGVIPNKITYITALNACNSSTTLLHGRFLHTEIVKRQFESDAVVATSLIDMYSKCGSLEEACQIFQRMSKRDIVSWNVIIAAYAQHGNWVAACDAINKMQLEGLRPNKVTVLNALRACSNPPSMLLGKAIHHYVVERGLEDAILDNALVDMYGKCGDLQSAKRVLDSSIARDVVTWNAMITAFTKKGYHEKAFQSLGQMQLEGVVPDNITLKKLLESCSSSKHIEAGRWIHSYIVHNMIHLNVGLWNSIIQMYDTCGSLQEARRVFEMMDEHDMFSWSAIIATYVHHGDCKEALNLFWSMHFRGAKPDYDIFLNIVGACGVDAFVAEAKMIHDQAMNSGFEFNLDVGTALIDMYGKAGDLQKALSLFEHLPRRDLVCWSALLAAYAQNGCGRAALELFGQLQLESIMPNKITLISVFSACAHAGMVNEGYHHFFSTDVCGRVEKGLEHYGCMIDLLARAGYLEDAEHLIAQMPYEASTVIWMSLLSACTVHGDIGRGKRAAAHLLRCDPQNPAFYAALSNMMQQDQQDEKILLGLTAASRIHNAVI